MRIYGMTLFPSISNWNISPTGTSFSLQIKCSPSRGLCGNANDFSTIAPLLKASAPDNKPRNLANSRRLTCVANLVWMGKSFFQLGTFSGSFSIGVHLFDDQLMSAFGHHDGHFGIDGLIAELKGIDRHTIRPHSLDLLSGAIIERLAWADRCAHGLLSGTGPVIAHIAFHHQFGFFFFFGLAIRSSHYAVGTTDTAGSI